MIGIEKPNIEVFNQEEKSWLVISSGFQSFSNIVFSLYC